MNILQDSPRLGVHSDVILFRRRATDMSTLHLNRYVWVHHKRRPFGIRTPLQCPQCGCLKTVKVTEVPGKGGKRIRHRCVARLKNDDGVVALCLWVLDINVPSAMAGCRGRDSVEGQWVVVTDGNASKYFND